VFNFFITRSPDHNGVFLHSHNQSAKHNYMSKRHSHSLGNSTQYQSGSTRNIYRWLKEHRQRIQNWYKSMFVQPIQSALNQPPRWKQTIQAKAVQRRLQIQTTSSYLYSTT